MADPSFKDWIVEVSSTTGLSDYVLGGAPAGTSYFPFRHRYADGSDKVFYWVRNHNRTKWEKHQFETLTYGSPGPDELSRAGLVESTDGDGPISWVLGDLPLTIYVAPDSDASELAITGGAGDVRNPASRDMAPWADNTAGYSDRVPVTVKPVATEIEVGAWEGSVGNGIYVPSPRRPVLAVGAANLDIEAEHVGWWITFNTTAAVRNGNLPSGAAVGMGYTVRLQPTSDIFPLAVVPDGSDAIDSLAGGTTFFAHGKRYFEITWDGTKWQTSIADMPLYITRQGNAVTSLDVQNIAANIHSADIEFNCRMNANDATVGMHVYDSTGALVNGAGAYTYNLLIFNGSGLNQVTVANTLMLWNFHGSTVQNSAVWGFTFSGKILPLQSTTQGVKCLGKTFYLDSGSAAHTVIADALRTTAGRATGIRISGATASNILDYDLKLKGYARL